MDNKARIKYLANRIDQLEAIIGDVQAARVTRNMGYTGGGNPLISYDTKLIELALVGLGKQSQELAKENLNETT